MDDGWMNELTQQRTCYTVKIVLYGPSTARAKRSEPLHGKPDDFRGHIRGIYAPWPFLGTYVSALVLRATRSAYFVELHVVPSGPKPADRASCGASGVCVFLGPGRGRWRFAERPVSMHFPRLTTTGKNPRNFSCVWTKWDKQLYRNTIKYFQLFLRRREYVREYSFFKYSFKKW